MTLSWFKRRQQEVAASSGAGWISTAQLQLNIETLAGPRALDGVRIRSDLLPLSARGSDIRTLVDNTTWNLLCNPARTAANNRCEICGVRPGEDNGHIQRAECHEKWIFTCINGRPVQRLVRMVALCRDCHRVQHYDRARAGGEENLVTAHLRRLNAWTEQQAREDLGRALERCTNLMHQDWDLDLRVLYGTLAMPDHPALYIPAADRFSLGDSYHYQ